MDKLGDIFVIAKVGRGREWAPSEEKESCLLFGLTFAISCRIVAFPGPIFASRCSGRPIAGRYQFYMNLNNHSGKCEFVLSSQLVVGILLMLLMWEWMVLRLFSIGFSQIFYHQRRVVEVGVLQCGPRE